MMAAGHRCDYRCANLLIPVLFLVHSDGLPHKRGTRMATMVMYCKLPERGGHTNFLNANVHIKPTKNAAVFFSYIDPKTNLTDLKFTEHSGCPVWEGSKKIVTQWVRYGVDAENPWHNLNTSKYLADEVLDCVLAATRSVHHLSFISFPFLNALFCCSGHQEK